MDFHVGDSVIHWIYGFGKIIKLEKRKLPGQASLYFVVQLKDLTVWVPVDEELASRLRSPTPRDKFEKLFAILRSPGKALPNDRLERRTLLLKEQKDGCAEANCRIIRDLSSFSETNPMNDNDKLVLKRTSDSLLGEWMFSLSVSLAQAEIEMNRLLNHRPRRVVI